MRKLLLQFTRFGLVGGVGLVVDFGVFNLLRATIFEPSHVHEGPVFAKIVSTILAIIVNWVGNRFWTFREHRGRQLLREGIEFGVVSVGGMLIGLLCLFVSHYVLGYTSLLADNISSNVIGLALGTAFRFSLYRFWVFSPRRGEPKPALFPGHESPGLDAAPAALTAAPTPSSRHPAPTAPVVVAPQSD
ncbi:GtrA family protein [Lysinimonas soli]|uniref:GtrA family protein n=1 Tax=Lysinimonas soli TaxID=1074233 RepID=A0ABW0NSQ6_9MICO